MWKTGHSHIKRRVKEIGALCGFEKSGHFFINEPLGLGFDDGLKSACLMLQYLSNDITKKLSVKKLEIKKTFQSPTMAPFCVDSEKYQVVDSIIKKITDTKDKGGKVGNQNIEKILLHHFRHMRYLYNNCKAQLYQIHYRSQKLFYYLNQNYILILN